MQEDRKTRIERSFIGNDFILYKFYPVAASEAIPLQMIQKLKHTFVLDNSSSMGHYSHDALIKIGCSFFDMACTVPGTLIAFDTHTTIYENLANSKDVLKITLPRQNATDITTAIQKAIRCIANDPDKSIHHVLTFLSDGQHNSGPMLTNFDDLKVQLGSDCKLSVIVVGIAQCDTSLGMRIKTSLETVSIPGLESIYFAKSHSEEFELVAAQVLSSMEAFFVGGTQHNIAFANAEHAFFLDSYSPHTSVYLRSNAQILIAKKIQNHNDPVLLFDGVPVFVQQTQIFNPSDIEGFFDIVVPKLSQLKIANNGNMQLLNPRLILLDTLLQCAEQVIMAVKKAHLQETEVEFKGDHDDEYKKIDTKTRLRLVRKKWKTAEMLFQSERSRIEQLRATIQNTSASQAAYLIGINKKYAAKAVARAATVNISSQEVLHSLASTIIPKLEASFAVQNNVQNENVPMSILSCNTAREQLQDWITTAKMPDLQCEDIYSLLVAFGFVGYPVDFLLNNAVQVDPFQTQCLDIETVPIDTCTLMFAKRMDHKLLSPNSQKPMSNCLVLVDCVCPKACLVAMRSEVYQYLLSCSLCNDLYMYNGQMTFAAHAHALLRCMKNYVKCKSSSGIEFLTLAVKIVYSMRLFWSVFENTENKSLLKHWFEEWGTITQSLLDRCNHPVQLLLLLAVVQPSKEKEEEDNSQDKHFVPLVNLCCEVLARNFKGYLLFSTNEEKKNSDAIAPNAQPNTKKMAIKLLQRLFGITSDNSPKPIDDVLSDEPTIESIRANCQNYADFDEALFEQEFDNNFDDAMYKMLFPYVIAYRFALQIRTIDIQTKMEICGDVPEQLAASLHTILSTQRQTQVITDIFERKNLTAMFAQSMLCHDSANRVSIVDFDTQHPATLQDIIVELRLVYYLNACKVKSSEYLKIIGNVTLAEGLKAGSAEFDAMIGAHSHGLSREKFWALHDAAEKDAEKQRLFLAKSNGTVCFKK